MTEGYGRPHDIPLYLHSPWLTQRVFIPWFWKLAHVSTMQTRWTRLKVAWIRLKMDPTKTFKNPPPLSGRSFFWSIVSIFISHTYFLTWSAVFNCTGGHSIRIVSKKTSWAFTFKNPPPPLSGRSFFCSIVSIFISHTYFLTWSAVFNCTGGHRIKIVSKKTSWAVWPHM